MAVEQSPQGPFKLVTVNTAPERARRLIGRMIEALSSEYQIEHVANCETIDEVRPVVAEKRPDVLFCASMWTDSEVKKIRTIAEEVRPGIAFYALPHGLQVERGPDAVVDHLVEHVPELLESHQKNRHLPEH